MRLQQKRAAEGASAGSGPEERRNTGHQNQPGDCGSLLRTFV